MAQGEDEQPKPGSTSPRLLAAAAALLLAIGLGIGGVRLTDSVDARVAAEESRILGYGVELTARFEPVQRRGVTDTDAEDDVRVIYEYAGVVHRVRFNCAACRKLDHTTVWVDPADPADYVTEQTSAVKEDNAGLRVLGYLLTFAGGVIVFALAVGWRWWLAGSAVSRGRNRRRADPSAGSR